MHSWMGSGIQAAAHDDAVAATSCHESAQQDHRGHHEMDRQDEAAGSHTLQILGLTHRVREAVQQRRGAGSIASKIRTHNLDHEIIRYEMTAVKVSANPRAHDGAALHLTS